MRIFSQICTALREGREVRLASIVATSGSTPAPAQSRMLVYAQEALRAEGTIGGGCLDASILFLVEEAPQDTSTRILRFELNDDAGDTGLMCGGTVTVLLEPLDATMLPLYERLAAAQAAGEDSLLATALRDGRTYAKTLLGLAGERLSGTAAEALPPGMLGASTANRKQPSVLVSSGGDDYILEYVEADPRLFIFGAGHVGKAIADCAARAGFHVTVIDDRPQFAVADLIPAADQVLCGEFDGIFERLAIPSSAYVVIVTRGHRHDELLLTQAVREPLRYLGMIGSRRKVKIMFDRLAAAGIPRERLDQVYAPIGLDIGALTPAEIAVSIVAELIKTRRLAM